MWQTCWPAERWEPIAATWLLPRARRSGARQREHAGCWRACGLLDGARHQGQHRHRGRPTPLGTTAVPWCNQRRRPPAARLRETGAVMLIAKTTMPTTACCPQDCPNFHRLARATWDLSKGTQADRAPARAPPPPRATARCRRHRHWRLHSPAGQLVRHLWPETQPGPRPHRTLHRPRRRILTHRAGRGADDAGAERA